MNKTTKILLGILVLQLAIALFSWTSIRQNPTVTTKTKLLNVESDAISRLEIVGMQGEKTEPPIVLTKKNDTWLVESADDYPAQSSAVEELLDTLTTIELESPIAVTDATHRTLNVAQDAFDRKITLTANGTAHVLILGRGARSSTNLRRDGTSDVYEVSNLSIWNIHTKTSNYVDTALVDIDIATLDTVTIDNTHGTLKMKKDNDRWTIPELAQQLEANAAESPDEEANTSVDHDKIKGLINKLTSLTMTEPVGKTPSEEFGLTDGTTVRLSGKSDDADISISYIIGAKTDTHRYLKKDDLDWIVTVSNHSVEDATTRKLDDFIKKRDADSDEDGDSPAGAHPQFDGDIDPAILQQLQLQGQGQMP